MPNAREKLIELLMSVPPIPVLVGKRSGKQHFVAEHYADHLLAHGVTVQQWISVPADELKNHIDVPVCFSRKLDGCSWWAIIRGIKGDKVSTDYDGYFKLSEYGETWMVKYLPLPQPPKGEQ